MQGREKAQFGLFGTTPIDQVLPADHPLRRVRALFDEAWKGVAPAFDDAYGKVGNVSCPPAMLLRANLLRALYSIKSERALCEQISMNAGFRWFVGLDWDDKVFDHSTLSFNRERLFGNGAAEALLGEICRLAEMKRLLSSDRLVVDGTLIKAWASHRSFQPKDGPPEGGNFKGKTRSNETHESTTDPDAKLFRKGGGQESMLCHLGSLLVDSASGLVRAAKLTPPCGLGRSAEIEAALNLAGDHLRPGQTLVGDRGYDVRSFVSGLRALGIRAHPRAKSRGSSLDGRTTARESYRTSMRKRFIVEQPFAWLKSPGRMRQTMLRGTEKVGWEFHMFCMAYNLRRMAKLCM
ncbi:MAG: IS5 family transposase [Fimbriimonadaceae bacterium]|nr:IS5 family transposase [Fimbriimonadaceae bacterium]